MIQKIDYIKLFFLNPYILAHPPGYSITLNTDKRKEVFMFTGNGKIHSHLFFNKNNKKDGLEKVYNIEGEVTSKIYYKNGRMNGEYRMYYPNGKLMIACRFDNGRIKGKYRCWDKFGNLRTKNLEPRQKAKRLFLIR